VFYTNYNSRKGQELAAGGRTALAFWWEGLQRQVRAGCRVWGRLQVCLVAGG
jgi:pyridoxamine 5'-phosphate oxidase